MTQNYRVCVSKKESVIFYCLILRLLQKTVWEEGKKMKKKKKLLALLLAICVVGLYSFSTSIFAADENTAGTTADQEKLTTESDGQLISKTASRLDSSDKTNITLSLPSSQQQMTSDVVFVLDCSSCGNTVASQAAELLSGLKDSVTESGASVNIGIVGYRGTAAATYDLQKYDKDSSSQATEINTILTAKKKTKVDDGVTEEQNTAFKKYFGDLEKGSNMASGLRAAREMLAGDNTTAASRKYVVLISDGSTYTYPQTEAANDYSTQYSSTTGEGNMGGGLYEWASWFKSEKFTLASNSKLGDSSNWENYMTYIGNNIDNNVLVDQQYSRGTENNPLDKAIYPDAKNNKQDVSTLYSTTYKGDDPVILNSEKSMYEAANDFKYLKKTAGYNCYVYQVDSTGYEVFDSFINTYLTGISGNSGLSSINDIKNDILYSLGIGSTITDEMGSNFNFIDSTDNITLKVGDNSYKTVAVADDDTTSTTYNFEDSKGNVDFTLTYYANGTDSNSSEHFVFKANKAVSNFQHITLNYSEQLDLTKKSTASGTHYVKTNGDKTVLDALDSNENLTTSYTASPVLSYTIQDNTPIVSYSTYNVVGNYYTSKDKGATYTLDNATPLELQTPQTVQVGSAISVTPIESWATYGSNGYILNTGNSVTTKTAVYDAASNTLTLNYYRMTDSSSDDPNNNNNNGKKPGHDTDNNSGNNSGNGPDSNSASNNASAPNTGDTSDLGLWIILGGSSIALAGVLIALRKRQQN